MGRIIGGFFVLLIGLGMLYGTYALWSNGAAFRAKAQTVEGTVVDFASERDSKGKTMYSPIVEYTPADGQTLQMTGSTSSSSPSYSRGEKVQVMYDPATPEAARLDTFMEKFFGPLILGFFAVIVTLLGWFLFFGGIKNRRVRAWLAQHGMKVRAKLAGVELNEGLKVNGRSPWRLRAQWQHPVTQKVYIFYSDNVWFDPTEFCNRESVDAVVNADDPRQYMVDTSFLPEKA
jgi:hypothetical protein